MAYREGVNAAAAHDIPPVEPRALLAASRTLTQAETALRHDNVDLHAMLPWLVSFSDDLGAAGPSWVFPDRAVRYARTWWANQPGPVSLAQILLCKAIVDCPTPLERILAAHALLRQVARGRDNNSLQSNQLSLQERLKFSATLAPFPPALSHGGDPLGDAYHYLANLAVGFASAASRSLAWGPVALFAAGPTLMSAIRERTFGSVLFFGNHALIDHLGLCHGVALGLEARGSHETPRR